MSEVVARYLKLRTSYSLDGKLDKLSNACAVLRLVEMRRHDDVRKTWPVTSRALDEISVCWEEPSVAAELLEEFQFALALVRGED